MTGLYRYNAYIYNGYASRNTKDNIIQGRFYDEKKIHVGLHYTNNSDINVLSGK
jgi:hypothetical protein